MKRTYLILFAVILQMAMASCTQESLAAEEAELYACCGNEGDIPPPPTPPPTGGN